MWGSGILKGLGITFKHLWERKITEQYPEERPKLYPRFRGRLMLNPEKCIVCGMCVKSCPNNVLSFTEARLKESKKKVLTSYTIDHQYCMFCNLCVEACPTNGLYFSHDFEWAAFKREDIKTVYEPDLTGLELLALEEGEKKSAEKEAEDKLLKGVNAMIAAIKKNPARALSKVVESEEEALKLSEILGDDESKIKKLAELMVSDKEKAAKVAKAFLIKGQKKEQEG
ncbi:NADH-quinone oxidoreductase subunit I [Thermosyntropha lipolytica DSM 11003]|uniref:NADH-quinone oxidoreductase subunit I n=1 Tax=Thermosyntropha lipolytica DSM 11003 TaxID=1123382 RepID=A0A1M5P3V5_9FIRM|nr:NADH-quinone oxidoreductase subunit I [Thermosyntropha lipolytica]SHG96428.1 NADH-quinone oxidoreductase subunit I [Thermosyntropha lipolytica DSM 11003]